MITAYAVDGSVVAGHILDLIEDNKDDLSIAVTFLGDQRLLPATPAVCVVQGDSPTELVGAPRRVQTTFEVLILVYHSKLQDSQVTELECNQRAEAIRHFLDENDTLDGLVIQSFCTNVEPGFTRRGEGENNWYRSSRITWSGMSRYNL